MSQSQVKTRTKTEQIAMENTRAAWRWGFLIVMLLASQLVLGGVAIMIATSDSSVAVVPDYYQKAMKWDEEIAARSASSQLGWTVTTRPIDLHSTLAGLSVEVVDRLGQPVAIQTARLRVYHHAAAGDAKALDLSSGAMDGLMFASACFDRSGFWQIEIELIDDERHRFVESREIEVSLSPATGD